MCVAPIIGKCLKYIAVIRRSIAVQSVSLAGGLEDDFVQRKNTAVSGGCFSVFVFKYSSQKGIVLGRRDGHGLLSPEFFRLPLNNAKAA